MKLALERQIQLAFIFGLILLTIIGFFAYRSVNSLGEAVKWEKHTQEVLLKLDETLISIVDAETSGRGFLITADDSYLEPYKQTGQNINGTLSQLRLLLDDNPQQTERLNKVEGLIKEKYEVLTQSVELRRTQDLESVRNQLAKNRGRDLMNGIRSSIGEMKNYEKNLLIEREGDLEGSVKTTQTMLLLGSFAGILSLGLANFAIFGEVGKRRHAENEIRDSNKSLEKRVEERTGEILAKNEELKEQIRQREQSENRRRTALEAGNLGTWTLDPKNNKAEVDERSLTLFGFGTEDFDGSHEKVFSRIHEEDYPQIEELFQKSLAERASFNAKFRVRMPDGSTRWNHCIGQPQYDENGELVDIVGHCNDITENKEYESFLLEKGHFNRAILDSLSAHIAVLDEAGNIIAVNEAWENFAQGNCVEEQQISSTGVGQNYLRVCERSSAFEEETKETVKNLQSVLDGREKGFAFEYPCHSPTEERWFLLQVSAMRGAEGGAVISHIDISARKKAEQELKNSEQFNRSVFENSPDCVKVLNLDGTLQAMNINGLCIMEIDEISPFIGRQWVDFWESDENELAYQAVQTASKGNTSKFEGFCKTAKGNLKYWDVSVAPIFDAEGKTIRLLSTSRDVTERREAEQEREKLLKNEQIARKDAEIANRMRDEFLATVSHELRAPLNSILGWGRLLEKGNLDETTTTKAINTIVRNAESQNRLIEDLLDVSRIISGKLRLEVMTIKPINLVESALETVRPAAEAKGIKLEIKEDVDISHISGDPNRLQQVIWNLLSNAIKFTPNDGRVTLEIERDNDFVELRVKDTGVGIKEEFLPHVFDRFRQADASSIRKFGGLGLGLAIVRHITEMHGGTVDVFSEGEGTGSTFTVKLPLIPSPSADDDEKAKKSAASENSLEIKLDGLLILVVDDEEDTRQLLVQSLTFQGATVISADSAEHALEEIEEKSPDVMVSDIGMPDEDGYSLIRKVRALPDEQHRSIPAIALTAFTRAQDRMRALSSGFQSHVSKPVEPDELTTVIASLTGRLKIGDAD